MGQQWSEKAEVWWIGDPSDPMAAPAGKVLASPPTEGPAPDALLVSGALDPVGTSRSLSEWIGYDTVPWIVVLDRSSGGSSWMENGAWSVLPSECGPREAMAAVGRMVDGIRLANLANPLTGLPGNPVIERLLESRITDADSTVAYVDITDFKPFNDYYGFARGDVVIRSLASVLTSNLARHFVGHIGGDDFVCISRGAGFRRALDGAVAEFRRKVPAFYDERDKAAGGIETLNRKGDFQLYPFMDLTVSLIQPGSVSSVEQLARTAGLRKKEAKGEPHTSPLLQDDGIPAGAILEGIVRSFSDGRCRARDAKAVIEACGLSGDRSVLPGLLAVLESDECPDLRKSAALALAGLPAEEVREPLMAACRDHSAHVRKRAVDALALLGGSQAGPVLARMMQDRSSWVRRAALRGLGMCGWKQALPALLSKTRHRGTGGFLDKNVIEERRAALEGLALMSGREASTAVSALTQDRQYRPMRAAWKTLMMLGGDEAARSACRRIASSGSPPPGIELIRGEEISGDCLRSLYEHLCGLVDRSGSSNLQVLATLRKLPGELPDLCLDRLMPCFGYMRGRELEELVSLLNGKDVPPPAGRLPRLVGRMRSDRRLLSKRGCVELMGWIARLGKVHPGLLIEPFLRHHSREVRAAAARAVLCSARRLMSETGLGR